MKFRIANLLTRVVCSHDWLWKLTPIRLKVWLFLNDLSPEEVKERHS